MKVEIERCFIETYIVVSDKVEDENATYDHARVVLTANDLNSIRRFSEWAILKDGQMTFSNTMLWYMDGSTCLLDHKFKDFKDKYYQCIRYTRELQDESIKCTRSIQESSSKRNEPTSKGRFRTFFRAFKDLFRM